MRLTRTIGRGSNMPEEERKRFTRHFGLNLLIKK